MKHMKKKIKTKTVKYEKEKLKHRIESLLMLRDKTVASLKQRLDKVVEQPLNDANEVLNEKNNDVFLEKCLTIGAELDNCERTLFQFSLQWCSDSDATDSSSETESGAEPSCSASAVSQPKEDTIAIVHETVPAFNCMIQPSNCESITTPTSTSSKLLAKPDEPCNPVVTATFEQVVSSSSLPLVSLPSTAIITQSIDENNKECIKEAPVACGPCDFNNRDSPEKQSISDTSLEDDLSRELNECLPTPHSYLPQQHLELDLLMLHNIEVGVRVPVIVSDVVDPSQFSVQPVSCEEQIKHLQHRLNDTYSKEINEHLKFKELPRFGALCVALYQVDQCWYRAKIGSLLPDYCIEVTYIDFGNCGQVSIDDLRVIQADLANIPPLSIQCSLNGVEPVAKCKKWSTPAKQWFQERVFGKYFKAEFAPNSVSLSSPVHFVHLFTQSDSGDEDMLTIAHNLVSMGYAMFVEAAPPSTEESSSAKEVGGGDTKKNKVKSNSPATSTKPHRRRNPARGLNGHINPSSGNSRFTFSHAPVTSVKKVKPHQRPKNRLKNEKTKALSVSPDKRSQDSTPPKQNQALVPYSQVHIPKQNHHELEVPAVMQSQSLMNWNPMVDDFVSPRNRYDVDMDDACVVLENLDPEKMKKCKYFEKGDCWKGELCERSHFNEDDVMYETEVLSAHALPGIDLVPDNHVIVKVVTDTENEDFYAQVIHEGVSPDIEETDKHPAGLKLLTEDMKSYYARNVFYNNAEKKTRAIEPIPSDEVSMGQMCTYLQETLSYCRASVLDMVKERVEIHLVDYGEKLWVSSSKLLPLHITFMHLPAQAVLCTFNKEASAEIPEKDCIYLARVGDETTPMVDSPPSLTLLRNFP